jgi:hypothetical protein
VTFTSIITICDVLFFRFGRQINQPSNHSIMATSPKNADKKYTLFKPTDGECFLITQSSSKRP